MPIRVRVLASGSSGNAIFVRMGEVRILVDVGVSLKHIAQGLRDIGESVAGLSAVLITHEHSDHVVGLPMLRREHPTVPVFATAGTALGCKAERGWVLEHELVRAGTPLSFEGVEVRPFATVHDAREPVGFRFDTQGFAMAIATDLGRVTAPVEEALRGCRLLLLEANYDAEMLQWGAYPTFLKRRIAGGKGHLSNAQAGRLLAKVRTAELDTVVLCHLSEKNNEPGKAVATVGQAVPNSAGLKIMAAARKTPSPPLTFVRSSQGVGSPQAARQLALFDPQ